MVFKGYRKPLEIEDIWELKSEQKTQAMYAALEKNMKTAVRKAQAEMEKRKRKKRHRERDPDHENNLSKAQSQDILMLVNPLPLLALNGTERSRSSLGEWGHLTSLQPPWLSFPLFNSARPWARKGEPIAKSSLALADPPCFERPRKSPSLCPVEGRTGTTLNSAVQAAPLCLNLPFTPILPSNEVRVSITMIISSLRFCLGHLISGLRVSG